MPSIRSTHRTTSSSFSKPYTQAGKAKQPAPASRRKAQKVKDREGLEELNGQLGSLMGAMASKPRTPKPSRADLRARDAAAQRSVDEALAQLESFKGLS